MNKQNQEATYAIRIVNNLGKQYKRDFWAFKDFSLDIKPGILGLLWHRTALVNRHSCACLPPSPNQPMERSHGTAQTLSNHPILCAMCLAICRRILAFTQTSAQLNFSNTWLPLKDWTPALQRERIDELLQLTNLVEAAKRPLGGYSGGMKQRVGIAQALLNDPQLLIVDEPTVGWIPKSESEPQESALRFIGKRIVMSTHIVSDVGCNCHRYRSRQ